MRSRWDQRGGPPGRPARCSHAGFTLLEVCASIVLLTVIIGGVIGAQVAAVNLTRSARDTEVATSDARAALEEILLEPADEIPGEFPEGTPLAAWTDHNLPGESIVPSYPNMGGAAVPNPLEIRVTVTWTESGGRERSVSLATVKVR